MKHLTLLILVFSFLVAHLQPVAVTIWFVTNQAEIAATKCVQRTKPKNCCVGKCQLRKALKNQKQHSAQAQYRIPELTSILSNNVQDVPLPEHYSSPLLPGVYTLKKDLAHRDKVFQPPKGYVVS